MKNLKLLYEQTCQVLPNCRCFTVDHEASKFYVADNNTVNGYLVHNYSLCFDLDLSMHSSYLNADFTISIVGLQYLCGEEQICIALQNGDILLCGTADKQVEIVGTLDCEIVCMSWSPDQEIVLFVTDAGRVVAMNHDFDPLSELEISTGHFGEGDFVNVGWGSIETQFQGSAGKIIPGKEKKAEVSEVLHDDKKTKIAWRGDGQYFAISTIENSQRRFRVWNRSCELQYTSEQLPGMESCFCWKPSGSLIATSQRKVHRHDIVFFELNGLQHGEFSLPFQQDQVHIDRLDWNCDSSILALSAIDRHSKNTFLQLWSASNYHWSLKQSLELSYDIAHFSWDSELPYSLHVIGQNGLYVSYNWSWCVDCTKLTCINSNQVQSVCLNSSVVCVIDGSMVRVTPFKQMIIPPPMCAFQLQFKSNVRSLCFLEDASQPICLGVLLNDGIFVTFTNTKSEIHCDDIKIELMASGGNGFTAQVSPFSVDAVFKPTKSDSVPYTWWLNLRHLVWDNRDTLSAISCLEGVESLLIVTLDRSKCEYTCQNSIVLLDNVVSMCPTDQVGHVLVQLKTGDVLKYCTNEMKSYICHAGNKLCFGLPCSEMQLCAFSSVDARDDVYGLVALSHQKRLFIDSSLVSAECTSFYVHKEYIIYTTSAHMLHFVPKLRSVLEKLAESHLSAKEGEFNKITRSIERGARLIIVTPDDTKTVLQLPRGNLEIIHPRPLLISLIKYDLTHGMYLRAFTCMRKHRINMNLIHDHNPDLFFQNVNRFIKDLDSVEHLNLFLSELQENDVTHTMYSQFYTSEVPATVSLLTAPKSKVKRICEGILDELQKLDNVKYLLSILTAYVRKPTPEIEQAFKCLKTMQANRLLSENMISDALRHLHVMVESRVLFQEALATYDLDLALTVAQISHNDPKEYLPFLNELEALEENYKRYKIDMHLKKYSRALINISNCQDSFTECLELIRSRNLHKEALALFKRFTPEYREISNLYAEALTAEHKYEEAGIVLARCDNHRRAVKCFTAGGCWQLAFISAYALQYTPENFKELANILVENLVAKNRHFDAASVLEEVENYEKAVVVLLKGKQWSYALRLISSRKLKDLIDTDLVPSLKQACDDMKLNLESYREQFNKHYSRLQIVREIKRERALLVRYWLIF